MPRIVLLLLAQAQAQSTSDVAQRLKLGLWQRGDAFPCGRDGCGADGATDEASLLTRWSVLRHAPVLSLRGGAAVQEASQEPDLDALRAELGPDFAAALDRNVADHEEDVAASCENFYCGDASRAAGGAAARPSTYEGGFASHAMGSVPPEDFAHAFKFPLDLIKVTSAPLIPPEEAEEVVATANAEGVAGNEYASGKYKLGGDWVKKMPRTLAWFNRRLETTIFPTAAELFPEVFSTADVLRAHSVY